MTGLGAALGAIVDQLVGEPPVSWHPVARFGSMMRVVEERIHADRRTNGVVHLGIGVSTAAAVGIALRTVLGRHAATAVAVAACAAGRMLEDEAAAMRDLLAHDDLDAARRRVRSLVGRDPTHLDAAELSRAVVESVAENLVDAVTATLWWGAVGGSVGASAHRAVNTLDAMVGHRDERYRRFGWASARLDDTLNFVPARLTAVAVAIATPRRAADVWRVVRRDASKHPSPNGGVVEAAFAAALGLRLGGVNRYGDVVEDRGTLGDGRAPMFDDIDAALRLRRRTTWVTSCLVIGAGAVRRRRR
jgi:adenosylcobinamide-phosphate synthase